MGEKLLLQDATPEEKLFDYELDIEEDYISEEYCTANFDEFINNNRHFVPLVEELGISVSLSQELDLFDGVYGLMRNARSLLADAEENKNDQSIDC